VLRVLAFGLFLASLSPATVAQVRIDVSIPKTGGIPEVHASVRNQSRQSITVCLDLGYSSKTGNAVEATPHPFDIQKQYRDSWSFLLNGTDIGGSHRPEVVESRKSIDYIFQPKASGHLRLVLNYWTSAVPNMECEMASKGTHKVTSKAFEIPEYYTMH
jgi:hypothetical protein